MSGSGFPRSTISALKTLLPNSPAKPRTSRHVCKRSSELDDAMHRGKWAQCLMNAAAPSTSRNSARKRPKVAALRASEKPSGTARPISVSISATTSGQDSVRQRLTVRDHPIKVENQSADDHLDSVSRLLLSERKSSRSLHLPRKNQARSVIQESSSSQSTALGRSQQPPIQTHYAYEVRNNPNTLPSVKICGSTSGRPPPAGKNTYNGTPSRPFCRRNAVIAGSCRVQSPFR